MKKTTLLLATLATTGVTNAATYNWANWSISSSTTASATLEGGTVNVTAVTEALSTQNVNMTGALATGFDPTGFAALSSRLNTTSWTQSFTVDLPTVTAGREFVIAFGNILHNTATVGNSNYRIDLYDNLGSSVALTGLSNIQSVDYQWLDGGGTVTNTFDDTVTLDTTTGVFTGTVVSGNNDANTDFFIAHLPTNVAQIVITTINPFSAGVSETVNFTISSVPEPSGAALFGLGSLGLFARRKR